MVTKLRHYYIDILRNAFAIYFTIHLSCLRIVEKKELSDNLQLAIIVHQRVSINCRLSRNVFKYAVK